MTNTTTLKTAVFRNDCILTLQMDIRLFCTCRWAGFFIQFEIMPKKHAYHTFCRHSHRAFDLFRCRCPHRVSFSLSLDVNSAAGDQAAISVNVSPDQLVAIQIFGRDIQNANGISVRFEYDGGQVVYDGFDAGDVLPNAVVLPAEHGTNFVQISLGALGGQATVNTGLVGTIRFRTTAAFSGTNIRLVRGELGRGGQFERVTLNVRVSLQLGPVAPTPDFDGDGVVGFADFVQLVNVFGSQAGAMANIRRNTIWIAMAQLAFQILSSSPMTSGHRGLPLAEEVEGVEVVEEAGTVRRRCTGQKKTRTISSARIWMVLMSKISSPLVQITAV